MLTRLVLPCSALRSELRARQDPVAENIALQPQLACAHPFKAPPPPDADGRLFCAPAADPGRPLLAPGSSKFRRRLRSAGGPDDQRVQHVATATGQKGQLKTAAPRSKL